MRVGPLSFAVLLPLVFECAADPQPEAELDAVIVTAQKRAQDAVDVPISMVVVDAAQLDRTRTQDLRDLARIAPNFAIQRQDASDAVVIRGVGGGGRNVGFSTRAGVYVDGVYVGQFSAVNQDALDIERIEVLRGPQGHLFGRNTVSGAVNIVTRDPELAASPADPVSSGRVELGTGRKQLREVRGRLNLGGEAAGLLLSASRREREGFTFNVPTGTDLENIDRGSVRAKARFLPAEAWTVTLSVQRSDDDSHRAVGDAVSDTFGTGPSVTPESFVTPYNVEPRQRYTSSGAALTLDCALADDRRLTAITGWQRTGRRAIIDVDYSPADFFDLDFTDRYRQLSQELRLDFGQVADRFSGVVGLYGLTETGRNVRDANAGSDVGLLPFGIARGRFAAVRAEVRTRSVAVFGALDWRMADRLTLNLGARQTREQLRLRDYSAFGPAVFGLATIPDFDDRRSSARFDPSVGLTWALDDHSNLYAKAARGFKSGGWNVDFISAADVTENLEFDDERVRSIELGYKWESADRRHGLSAAAFLSRYDDYQVNQFVDLGAGQTAIQLRNAAAAQSRGLEVGAYTRPAERWDLTLDLAWTDATFRRFPEGGGPGIDLDGKRLPYAPRFSGSLQSGYAWPAPALDAEWRFDGTLGYRASNFSGPENLPRQVVDARLLVDLQAELRALDSGWSGALWVRNALDRDYIDNRLQDFFQTRIVEYGEPRTYGFTVAWDW